MQNVLLWYDGATPSATNLTLETGLNDLTNTITFLVQTKQRYIDISTAELWVKIFRPETEWSELYDDRVKLITTPTADDIYTTSTWLLPIEITSLKSFTIQLSAFVNNIPVWNTGMTRITFTHALEPDPAIEERYPTILADLEGRVTTLEDNHIIQDERISLIEQSITSIDDRVKLLEMSQTTSSIVVNAPIDGLILLKGDTTTKYVMAMESPVGWIAVPGVYEPLYELTVYNVKEQISNNIYLYDTSVIVTLVFEPNDHLANIQYIWNSLIFIDGGTVPTL